MRQIIVAAGAGFLVGCIADVMPMDAGTSDSGTPPIDAATPPDTGADSGACGQNETRCNGTCIDTSSDLANCGGCGHACAVDSGIAACTNGTCGPAVLAGAGTQNDPWKVKPAPADCQGYLAAFPKATNGFYAIAPNGTTFADECDMTTSGGGWTLLVNQYVQTLAKKNREYLYRYNGHWYRSPPTMLVWDWGSGQELAGSYAYFDGNTTSSFTCNGSAEKPQFGIGCSNGGGNTPKCLPIYSELGTTGQCEICQGIPNVFGTPCTTNVSVFAR